MAVANRRADFACGIDPPDGSRWTLYGEEFKQNPRHTLPPYVWTMIHLWRLYRGSGYGVGFLPEAGGTMDQSALMMACFSVMSEAQAELDGDRAKR